MEEILNNFCIKLTINASKIGTAAAAAIINNEQNYFHCQLRAGIYYNEVNRMI